MDFVFSPEQLALRDSVRAFLTAEAPNDYVRRMAEHDDAGITPEVWRHIVDLGWTGLLVPESAGGLGLGIVDAVVVQEEMGRSAVPRPVLLVGDPRDAGGTRPRSRRPARRARGGHAARNGRARRSRLRRSDRARARARQRPRHSLQARRREADGARRSHRRLGDRPGPYMREGLQSFLVEHPEGAQLGAEPRRHAQVRRASSSTRPAPRSSARRAITPRSGVAFSTTRACSSAPS